MDKNAKIYIAGHKGLVGSAILRTLQAQGYANFVLRNSQELDLTNQAATEEFFKTEKPEYVILAAAKVGGIMGNSTHRADFIYLNLLIQNNVIGCSYKNGVKKLLFLGSSCIYPKNAPQPLTEDSLLTSELEYTNEPYALAKIAGIKLIESFNIQYGTNYLSVMPSNLYGINDNFDLKNGHAFPMIIRKFVLCRYLEDGKYDSIKQDLGLSTDDHDEIVESLAEHGITTNGQTVTLTLWGSGKPRREFLNVDDMAEASIFVLNNLNFNDLSKNKIEIRNTHINIGTGSDVSIAEFADMVKNAAGFTGEIAFDKTKPDGTMNKLMSVEKIHSLGWKHRISLEEGIRRTLKWYYDNKDAKK